MGRKLFKIFDRYINLLIILCLFILCFNIGTADVKQEKYREFTDKFMQSEMKENNIPGVAVVIIQNGEIVFSKGYGYGNVENQTNLSAEDSVFRVASIAKLITAAAVMKLAEEGKIDLDAPVNDYLKRFKISDKGYKEPVRVRHLLTHTEGFTQKSIGGKTLDYTELQDLGRFVERTMPKRFIEPGVMITYGNHASALLGVLIEDVTGETYSEYVKKEIFSPLGMNDSSFKQPVPENIRNKKITEYRYRDGSFMAVPVSYSHMVSAGGLHSTAADLAKFLLVFQNENFVFRKETLEKMTKVQYRPHPELSGVTYGFLEQRYKSNTYFYRTGDSEGAKAKIFLLPEQNTGIVILNNSHYSEVSSKFIDAFYDRFYPDEASYTYENRITEDTKKYEGVYDYAQFPRDDFTKIFRIFLGIQVISNNDGTITVKSLGEEPFGDLGGEQIFYQIKPLLFKSMDKEQYIAFGEDEKGKITYLYSGSGYHGSFVKIQNWYHNLVFHKFLYLGFSGIFFIHLLYMGIRKLMKKESGRYDFVSGIIDILNILFLSLYFPAVMIIGMSPGMPAYSQGVNALMLAVFAMPLFAVILTLAELILIFIQKNKAELKKQYFIITVNILFFIWIIYWRAVFW